MDIANQIFSTTILISVLTFIGFQLKAVPNLLWQQVRKQFVYSAHIEQNSLMFDYLEVYLFKFYNELFKNVAVKTVQGKVAYEHFVDLFLIKFKGKRILLSKSRDKLENASNFSSVFFSNFKLESWGGKKVINAFLEEVLKYNLTLEKKQQYNMTHNSYGEWIHSEVIMGKSIDNIYLKNKQSILDDFDSFIKDEEWYLKRGLNYRRGYLFHGPPGNGKTSLILALAKYLNKDVYFVSLNDLEKDNSLFKTFNLMNRNQIVVIEDIDAVFTKRASNKRISFSALLNCLDGIYSKYGTILILTTNHIDQIDEALIREGRVDNKIFIDNPTKDIIEEYLTVFFEKNIKLKKYTKQYSMAKVQEICLKNKNNIKLAISEFEKK